MKEKNLEPLKEPNDEMLSLNENIYDLFSAEELEQRLQTSQALVYGCGTDCGTFSCGTNNRVASADMSLPNAPDPL